MEKGSKQDCNWVLDKKWAHKKKIQINEENMEWNRSVSCTKLRLADQATQIWTKKWLSAVEVQ